MSANLETILKDQYKMCSNDLQMFVFLSQKDINFITELDGIIVDKAIDFGNSILALFINYVKQEPIYILTYTRENIVKY